MRSTLVVVALLASGIAGAQAPPASDSVARIDSVFSRFTSATPGCAVGVSRHGRTIAARAYGMANLEYDVPNTPETIFEAGSVSKQFTAAAILLLAQQGKLSLDDPVRKHVPELPDYGAPLTIRHLMHHTSGLRDWGTVAMIEGWPRGSRVHTHDHVLDIVARQRSLNFPPGSSHHYSNSGYNLMAIIVARVSGKPFAEFTRAELFEPLGMTRTSWRDDYTRIVKGRATAYAQTRQGFRLDMPFENVHGNGGLLTTVEDLLRWSANFDAGRVGGPVFLREQVKQGLLTSGREIEYAGGLYILRHRGVSEVSHSGATAGYRAFLARYPEHGGLTVAILCNHSAAGAVELGRRVADIFLTGVKRDTTRPKTIVLAPNVLSARAGLYRDVRTGRPFRFELRNGKLVDERGDEALAISATEFRNAAGNRVLFELDASGRPRALRLLGADGDTLLFLPEPPHTPTASEMAAFVGTYVSDEAASRVIVVLEQGTLLLRQPPSRSLELRPAYRDVFELPTGDLVRFIRNAQGAIVELSVNAGRVWDLRFQKAIED
jgi:CubicO group peptidase (beta-lactamase class C family)